MTGRCYAPLSLLNTHNGPYAKRVLHALEKLLARLRALLRRGMPTTPIMPLADLTLAAVSADLAVPTHSRPGVHHAGALV